MDPITVLALLVVGLLVPTAYAGLIGAPYAPTWQAAIQRAFDHIHLNSSDTVVDLGAGDGRVLLAAARRGAPAVGYELSPIMWLITWIRLKVLPLGKGEPEGVGAVKLRLANFYRQKLPAATTVIFVFLMPKIMPRVQQYLTGQHVPNCQHIVVYAFPFPGIEPQAIIREPQCLPVYIYAYNQLTPAGAPATN